MSTFLCDQVILSFYSEAMADERQEQVRLRLSESDLAKVSAIQDHLNSIGSLSSLGKVVSNAIDAYYSILVAEGSVPPNL